MSRPGGAPRSTPKYLLARLLSCQFIFAGPSPDARRTGAARAPLSVCSGQQGEVDEVPEQRLVAGIRTANICAPLRKVRSPILCTAPACWPRIASDSRSSYVMPRRQSPATAGPPPPTPPSRPRVSGKNTTPPPTTAGGALPSPKPQWLYAAVHGSEGALRTSHRLALDHQTAESMHRITRLNHSPHPAPALCSTQCAGARQRRSVRHSRVRERLAERHGLRQLKKRARACCGSSSRRSC